MDTIIDFIWEFIPEDEEEILKFFDGYNLPILSEEMENYVKLKEYILKIKEYFLDNIELVREKIKEINL